MSESQHLRLWTTNPRNKKQAQRNITQINISPCPRQLHCDIITGYCLKRDRKKKNQQETLHSKRKRERPQKGLKGEETPTGGLSLALLTERKQELIEAYRVHETDSGSPEVQVAILTTRINDLIGHFRTHKHDNHSTSRSFEDGWSKASCAGLSCQERHYKIPRVDLSPQHPRHTQSPRRIIARIGAYLLAVGKGSTAQWCIQAISGTAEGNCSHPIPRTFPLNPRNHRRIL
jgi:hypothetical protein